MDTLLVLGFFYNLSEHALVPNSFLNLVTSNMPCKELPIVCDKYTAYFDYCEMDLMFYRIFSTRMHLILIFLKTVGIRRDFFSP